jgi:hypothetical protein
LLALVDGAAGGLCCPPFSILAPQVTIQSANTHTMNPYEANPENIPPTDRYADVPLYGRYLSRPTDFSPDAKHVNCTTAESLKYWSTVLKKCTESNRIYGSQDGERDVFALGNVIIKSSHLKGSLQGRQSHRNYSYADANELETIRLARRVFTLLSF